jgi:hypothetical protein
MHLVAAGFVYWLSWHQTSMARAKRDRMVIDFSVSNPLKRSLMKSKQGKAVWREYLAV